MYAGIDSIFHWHCRVILGFSAIHLALVLLFVGTGHDSVMGLSSLFRLEGEANLPTVFSAFALLVCGLFCGVAARSALDRVNRYGWSAAAAVLIFLAADEALDLHGQASEIGHRMIGAPGSQRSLWYVPYSLLVIATGLMLLPWWLRLQRQIRFWLMISGGLFVFAAIGFEIIEGWLTDAGFNTHSDGLRYTVYYSVIMLEESLEMLAVALGIRTVLRHLGATVEAVGINVQYDKPVTMRTA